MKYQLITIDEKEMKKLDTSDFVIEDVEISTDDEYRNLAELLKRVKGKVKEIKDFFKEPKSKAHKVHKEISTMEKDHLKKLSDFETLAKKRIGEYLLDREESNNVENPLDPLKVKGVSSSNVYKWKITNEDKIPREYLQVNEKLINSIVKQTNGSFKIDGIEIYKEKNVRVKG